MAPLCLTCGSRLPEATSASLPENRLSAYLLLAPSNTQYKACPHPLSAVSLWLLPPHPVPILVTLQRSGHSWGHWTGRCNISCQSPHTCGEGWVCSARLGPAQLVWWQGHGPVLPISAPSGPLEVPGYRQRLDTTKTSHSVPLGREGLFKTQI